MKGEVHTADNGDIDRQKRLPINVNYARYAVRAFLECA